MISYQIISYYITSYLNILHPVISYEIISHLVISYDIKSEHLYRYTHITFAIQPISSATNCKLFKIKISLFSVRNFSSFQRLLNLHGFRRSSATARDAYFHPQFLQNQRDIAKLISRTEHVPDTTDDGKVILFIKIDILFRFFSFSFSCLFR